MICGITALNQSYISSHNHRQWKRRSADVGGLLLATANSGQGKGWVGSEVGTQYAELLSDMYNQTLNAVNEHNSEYVPMSLRTPTRSRLIRSLDCWHFEPHKLPEEEILACTMILFEVLYRIEGMEEAVGVPLKQVCAFVHHLRQIYRYENTYHNFEHALDVLQATQCYLSTAYMVPPVTILLDSQRTWTAPHQQNGSLIQTLGLRDIFALYIAAIGHDVGHPGVTNVFMKNAQTPLSLVFDGRSALENLHCQLLLRVMRHHGLGVLLDDPLEGTRFRKLLIQTVLATDMSVHKDFMEHLQQETSGQRETLLQRQILACQAILKNADISNPSRPFPVAQHWAAALMEEWTAQKDLEEHFCLETSVQPSAEPLGVAKSQKFFISTFAKPLLDLSVQAIPEMARYAQHCDMNLDRWITRISDLESRNSDPSTSTSATNTTTTTTAAAATATYTKSAISPPPRSPRQPSDFQSAFPLTLPSGTASSLLATPSTTVSIANSTYSSESDRGDPQSPCESVSSSTAPPLFSPAYDLSQHAHCSSVLGPSPNIQLPPPSSDCRRHTPSSSASSIASSSHGHHRFPAMMPTSPAPSSVASSSVVSQEHEAIRAAGRLSTRQLKKSTHRNSWCVTSTMLSPSHALPTPPIPNTHNSTNYDAPSLPVGVGLGIGLGLGLGFTLDATGGNRLVKESSIAIPSPLSNGVTSSSPSPPFVGSKPLPPPPATAPSMYISPLAVSVNGVVAGGEVGGSPLLGGAAASQTKLNAVPI